MGHEASQLIEVTVGGVRWQVQAEHRETLLGPEGLRLDDWLRTGQAVVIKSRPQRVVYRVELPGLRCYIKHHRLSDARAWLREWIRPSKARIEYERALDLAARGIATIVPLAVGERRGRFGPGDCFLITRTLDEAGPLDAFIETQLPALPASRQVRVRQRLAVALGEFMARLHDAGIAHHDLHCGNLLVRLDENDRPRLFLIDPHAVQLGPALDWRASRDNLSMLNRWLVIRTTRADRLRFWHAYHARRTTGARPSLSALELAREVERRSWRDHLSFWRHRDARCRGGNRYFRRVRAGAVSGHVVSELDAATLAPLLADPDEPFRRPGAVIRKNSRSTTVVELDMLIAGEVRRLIYKRFPVRGWLEPWLGLLRWPPALRSWVRGHALRERSLQTARPLAVLHRRLRGLQREGYLLTEKIPDALDLRRFLAALETLPLAERPVALRSCIDQVARLVRELHARQLSQRDLKSVNILASGGPGPEGAKGGVWLIDLVGVRQHRRMPRARKVQNLTRLHASFHYLTGLTRTDRLRFLRVYLQWGLRGRESWKRWWREIETATRLKVARNARTGRPLG